MRHSEPKAATYLAAVLATEGSKATAPGPYGAARDAEELCRLGRRAERIAVQQCNGPWTEEDERRGEKARERIAKRAAEILAPYGAKVLGVHGDPRGFVLTFRLPSGRSNSIGGDWGV